VDLLLDLDLDHDLGKQAAVEDAVRRAISDGRLSPGAPIPSSREFARQLGVARGTVVAAVDRLAAEGLLETRQGAPTRVAHVPPRIVEGPVAGAVARRGPDVDFYSGDPDLTLFPRSRWSAAVRSALNRCAPQALGYGDPRGLAELRTGLVEYLARTRGVIASVDRTIVTGGFTHSLAVIGRTLVSTGHRTAAVEDPSFWRHRELLADSGLRCAGVVVDADGLRVDELRSTRARAVLVTAGHHTPLGVSLTPTRRADLMAWAADAGSLIIEDDYDGELRFDRKPVRALQALDPSRVIYCGSASKSLAPGLRLAWCVLPPALVDPVLETLDALGGATVSAVEQLAFAEFLQSGRYDQQVRRVRRVYRERRDQLVSALRRRTPDVAVEGIDAGLKALLRLPRHLDELAVTQQLAERSVAVAPLSAFQIDRRPSPDGPALVVNYSRPYAHEYRRAVDRLVDSLESLL
jgi:GntR family transcriptional regulator/MocR family aminotransferase